jgi:hypothetical protein
VLKDSLLSGVDEQLFLCSDCSERVSAEVMCESCERGDHENCVGEPTILEGSYENCCCNATDENVIVENDEIIEVKQVS